MKRPLNLILVGAALTSAFFVPLSVQAGSGGQDSFHSIENEADREIIRRQQDTVEAEDAMRRGDAALQSGDLEAAYLAYKQAVDLTPDGPAQKSLRARALSRYSSTAIRYAEYLVSEGQYAKAESVAREVLEPRYNPDYRPAAVFLSRLEQPDYFNKTITPEFAEDRTKVDELLLQANGYFDSGRFDLAQRRYQQVLAVDKYNSAAFRGMEQVELGKQRYYDSAYNETRSRMLWQVDKAWERPKRRFVDARSTDSSALAEERRDTELMVARLNRIIIPSVDFRDATVRQTITFLQQRSRDLDTTEDDPERRGINIFLKLPPTSAPAPDSLETEGETAASAGYSADSRITLNLSNIPLYEALRYVATLAGLKVKVEPFAVSIVPLNEQSDDLENREFRVPPGFLSSSDGESEEVASAGRQDSGASGPRLATRQTPRSFLEAQGVPFPLGASASFTAGSSRLVVRNTASNLDLIEALVDAAMGEQPTQVEIEAKFVEISQNNLKELGFDWALGPFSLPGSDAVFGSGGTIIPSGQNSQWPFINPGTGGVVGGDSITSGLRSGSGTGPDAGLSVNSLNALLAQNAGVRSTGAAPGFFALSGVFSNPQFQMVIRALNQKKGVDLMAAPKVTTRSGQKATINIIRDFPYPQEFEPPQIPQSTGGSQTISILPDVEQQQDPVVTPSFPTDFTTRKLGVSLDVEPQIGPDGYTIDLSLSPEVVDFDGFINYGSPIYAPQPDSAAGLALAIALNPLDPQLFQRELLTENIINQPIFSVRKVTTSVSVWDGQTVALGGLIREDVQKVNDKVPVLGDIPMAGALFRSEIDQKIKKNLIIFVTARLMDAAGQQLRPEDDTDQEEIVEPLGLPEDLRKPSITAKGFRQK